MSKTIKIRQLCLDGEWKDIYSASTRSEMKRILKEEKLVGRVDISCVLIEETDITPNPRVNEILPNTPRARKKRPGQSNPPANPEDQRKD